MGQMKQWRCKWSIELNGGKWKPNLNCRFSIFILSHIPFKTFSPICFIQLMIDGSFTVKAFRICSFVTTSKCLTDVAWLISVITKYFSSSQWIGYQLLNVLLQNMHSAGSVYFLSPLISTFSFPNICKCNQYLTHDYCTNKPLAFIISIKMESQRVVMKEQIKPTQQYGEIIITVDEPLKNQTETFAFFTYNVTGTDMHGPFSVRRRYRDFDLLRRKLSQRWLGIYVPPISGKRSESNFFHVFKMFGNNDQRAQLKYAETRKRFLKYFCQGIAIRPYLYYCDIFQMFLRGGPDFQLAIQGCLDKQYSFILQQYENNFKHLLQQSQQIDFGGVVAINENHLRQLKESEDNLNRIYEAIYRNVHARDEFIQQFNVCMSTALPEYQQKFFLSHVGNDRTKLMFNKTEEFSTKLAQYRVLAQTNPIQLFLELVAYQIRQTKAFIQAIEGRKSAENRKSDLRDRIDSKQKQITNLVNGGFSLRSVFKSGTKQLQIKEMEMKLQILKNELYCIQKMITIMVANTNYELEQYKLRRGRQYRELFKNVAQKQMAQLKVYMQLLRIPGEV